MAASKRTYKRLQSLRKRIDILDSQIRVFTKDRDILQQQVNFLVAKIEME